MEVHDTLSQLSLEPNNSSQGSFCREKIHQLTLEYEQIYLKLFENSGLYVHIPAPVNVEEVIPSQSSEQDQTLQPPADTQNKMQGKGKDGKKQPKQVEICNKFHQNGKCEVDCKRNHTILPFESLLYPRGDALSFYAIVKRCLNILKMYHKMKIQYVLDFYQKLIETLESYYDVFHRHQYGQWCLVYVDLIQQADTIFSTQFSKSALKKLKKNKINLPEVHGYHQRLKNLTFRWLNDENLTLKNAHNSSSTLAELEIFLNSYAQSIATSAESVKSRIENILESLQKFVSSIWASELGVELKPFGSYVNTFGTSFSDLDLILRLPESLDPVEALRMLKIVLTNQAHETFVVKDLITETRVPIIKLIHNETGTEVDICVNNVLALQNSYLLKTYSDMDARVRTLVLAIKLWAKHRGCNNPRNATLTSYAWTLMIIYYLRICDPPVLCAVDQLQAKAGSVSGNKKLVAELFIDFYRFYGIAAEGNFNFFHDIVSIRSTRTISKTTSYRKTLDKSVVGLVGETDDKNDDDDDDDSEKDDAKTSKPKEGKEGDVLTDDVEKHGQEKEEKVGEDEEVRRDDDHEKHDSVEKSRPPLWRMCIEDPLEEHDLGRVIFSCVGQCHMLNEIRRVVTLFETSSSSSTSFIEQCFEVLENVPVAVAICSKCGGVGHFTRECPNMLCGICKLPGHFMRNCPNYFCYRCKQQGHFAKECRQAADRQRNKQPLVGNQRWSKFKLEPKEGGQRQQQSSHPNGGGLLKIPENVNVNEKPATTGKLHKARPTQPQPLHPNGGGLLKIPENVNVNEKPATIGKLHKAKPTQPQRQNHDIGQQSDSKKQESTSDSIQHQEYQKQNHVSKGASKKQNSNHADNQGKKDNSHVVQNNKQVSESKEPAESQPHLALPQAEGDGNQHDNHEKKESKSKRQRYRNREREKLIIEGNRNDNSEM